MIRIRYTMDSKRAGDVETARTLASAKRKVRCAAGLEKSFTHEKLHGYPRAWEVTCGDTVIADVVQLPRGARADYFPKYRVGAKRRKKR